MSARPQHCSLIAAWRVECWAAHSGPGADGRSAGRRLLHCVVSGLGEPVSERGAVDQKEEEIVIYWRPDCGFCRALLLRLKFTRLRYRKVDIRKDPDARAFVRSVADGNETVPTVVVAGRALVNPSKRQLIEAVRHHAPHALGPAR
jgi:mycoredoxin